MRKHPASSILSAPLVLQENYVTANDVDNLLSRAEKIRKVIESLQSPLGRTPFDGPQQREGERPRWPGLLLVSAQWGHAWVDNKVISGVKLVHQSCGHRRTLFMLLRDTSLATYVHSLPTCFSYSGLEQACRCIEYHSRHPRLFQAYNVALMYLLFSSIVTTDAFPTGRHGPPGSLLAS